jgi:hypothetical protein
MLRTKTGQKLKVLCSDRGGEYTGNIPSAYLTSKGIKHEVTTADMPQHNGVAKWMNQNLMDKVRSMLDDSGLPDLYCFDAILYASFLHNVTPTQAQVLKKDRRVTRQTRQELSRGLVIII